MSITRWQPLSPFSWPRLLDDFEDTAQRGLKVRETDKDIVVEAVVAGIPSENVEVEIEAGVLTIKAEDKKEEKGKEQYLSTAYQYYYTTALSGGQWDKAAAEIRDGIVTIKIPKEESAKRRKITIKTKAA